MNNKELDQEILNEFPPYEVENLTKEELLGDTLINYLVSIEDSSDRIRHIELVREKARKKYNKIGCFDFNLCCFPLYLLAFYSPYYMF